MQHDKVKINRNKRLNDFPELQVGYPERDDVSNPNINDVSNPNINMERIHVDFETLCISKKSAGELAREIRGSKVPQAK